MTNKTSSSKGNTRHVVPHSQGWANKKGGAERSTSVHSTKREAESIAREQSKREGSELIVHGKDCQIQRKDSHGNDPRKIKG